MEIRDLVTAILTKNLLAARQWVADAHRSHMKWEDVPRPVDLGEREMVVAAALMELLAGRADADPPAWTTGVGPYKGDLLHLDPGLADMPRTMAYAKAHGPAPLRRRNLLASPDFLIVR